MKPLSIVIICKNEEKIIGDTLGSVQGISDDILCIDSGSTDHTVSIIKQNGARVIETNWEGYGKTRNKALPWAKYDWVLMLDADEPIDDTLKQSILKKDYSDSNVAFKLYRYNFFGGKRVKYGEWGRKESHVRLFNRKTAKWQEVEVHEEIILSKRVITEALKGHILHYTADDIRDYRCKMTNYAMLSARKYYQSGKKSNFIKLYISPLFSFIYNYIFRLGFLDGSKGFLIAHTNAIYTYLKYAGLRDLQKR